MTTQAPAAPRSDAASGAPSESGRRLALSGVAFAALFVVGWFTTGGVTPHNSAPDQDWINWAEDNQWNGRISGFLMLLAGFAFLYFMASIRGLLGNAALPGREAKALARVAYGGALLGMGSMAMAAVTLAAASSDGANADPVVSKAVATAAGGPFLAAAMGFAAFLSAAGLLALRTGVFARWIAIIALIGEACFLVTFLTVLDGTTDGSPFGYAFFPAIVSLVICALATSVAMYRARTPSASTG